MEWAGLPPWQVGSTQLCKANQQQQPRDRLLVVMPLHQCNLASLVPNL